MVRTCPVCLPPGAITWLIENGRQLDLFLDGASPEVLPGLDEVVRLDKSVSVSGLVEVEGDALSTDKAQGLCSCDLPF